MASESKINLVINKLTKDQYNTALQNNQIEEQQLYMVYDDRGTVQGDTRYQLVNKSPTLSSITIDGVTLNALTCQAEDLAINSFQITQNTYPYVVYLPTIPDNGGRDFCVRVEVISSYSTMPSISFLGSNNESCDFESTDSSWATLEVGANLFNFTETKR